MYDFSFPCLRSMKCSRVRATEMLHPYSTLGGNSKGIKFNRRRQKSDKRKDKDDGNNSLTGIFLMD